MLYFGLVRVEEENEHKLPIIGSYIYDARYHVHPYTLSTSDMGATTDNTQVHLFIYKDLDFVHVRKM